MSSTHHAHPSSAASTRLRDNPLAYLAIGASMSLGGLLAVAVGHTWLRHPAPAPVAAEVRVAEPQAPAASAAPAYCRHDDVEIGPQCGPI